ncbi:MAG: DegV family protein [Dehalococcoidia bacterium]
MSNVLIMTDTVSCIPGDIAEKNNIRIIPAANIMFDGQTYIENVTISATEAYELIKKDPDKFLTSAPTPAMILEEYEKAGKEYKEIVHITLSGTLSAGYKTATLAAENFHEKHPDINIRILDSKTVGGAQGLIVLALAGAAEKGMTLEQLADAIEKIIQKTGGFFILETLRYIYRTGRMSKLGSRIASMFNIKPINMMMDDGSIEMADRTRNMEHGFEIIIELIKKKAETNRLHFMLNHANNLPGAEQLSEMLKNNFNCLSTIISDYSPVMGYGAGPGSIFVGFQQELDL